MNQKYRFILEKIVQDSLITVRVRWVNAENPSDYVLPELPYGAHRVEWRFVKNGEVKTCGYDFVVKDCQAPTITCNNGVSVNILANSPPSISLWVNSLVQYGEDNYTPSDRLKYAIRRSGTGTGFPSYVSVVSFNCQDLGIQSVEIWSKDLAGNTSFCETSVIIQDNLSACIPVSLQVDVCTINYCDGQPIPYVDFSLSGSNPALPPINFLGTGDGTGCLSTLASVIPVASNFTIVPFKNDNPLNGVNTLDLVKISRHILGTEPLSSPYKMMAADINNSGSVTGFDVVELHNLILGIYQDFPNNTSWRFIDSSFVFPDYSNPFVNPFDSAQIAGSNRLFYGIKIGDVDCSALQPLTQFPAEFLTIPDLHLQTNDIVEVPVRFLQTNQCYGFQFGLQFDSTQMEILEVIPPANGGGNYGFKLFPDHLNVSWFTWNGITYLQNRLALKMRIKALAPIQLSNVFSLTTNALHAEVYPEIDSLANLGLQFPTVVATTEPNASQTIFDPTPNPTIAGVRIPLRLEQSEAVLVEILDVTGRLLYQQRQEKGAGAQWLELPATAFPQAGMYFWRVQAGAAFRSGKIVRQ